MFSFIIVHYKNKKDLFECLDSLLKFKPKFKFEVIIVDNSEEKEIEPSLKNKYKNIKYIPSAKNIGYGSGINLGVRNALGEYIFILNPDVIFKEDIASKLLHKLKKNKEVNVISPILYTEDGKAMKQGAKEPTPLRAIFKFSFLDRLFPNNPFSKDYWVKNWEVNKLKQVDNVPGTALMLSKKIFDEVGGFDETFFLYFEEFDFCKRVRDAGYKLFIDPNSKLIHKWGTTTKLLKNRDQIFRKSRFYYFRKHFGLIKTLLVESFLLINKTNLLLFSILLSALLIRVYNLDNLAPFIGDQGWFFVSAKDFLTTGNVPLVGITSSHLWLHQGPLWTYLVSLLFLVFDFNPLSPFYFSAVADVLTIVLIYKIGTEIFSQRIAFISSILYAFSPFAILSSRMAYHTSLIPLFIACFIYFLLKWIKGETKYFPLIILSLVLLYNFELQTVILEILFLFILLYGFVKKTPWHRDILNKKSFVFSVLAFFPMIPILIYDFKNGFPQTIVFGGWILYKGFSFLTGFTKGQTDFTGYFVILTFLSDFVRKLVFIQNSLIAILISVLSFAHLLYFSVKKPIRPEYLILVFISVFLLSGILITKTPSDAYLMSMFVPVILMIGIFLGYLLNFKKLFVVVVVLIFILITANAISVLQNDYFQGTKKRFGPTLKDRENASLWMIKDSGTKSFTVIGKGEGSQFESYTAPYEYLSWYHGKEPLKWKGEVIYILSESREGITIEKRR
ncbi:MAG: glycosyltransferase [Candidatus Levybacteria bacterium]|nr:glycosyltransferase [Candidatus Levybacteria bacterium]